MNVYNYAIVPNVNTLIDSALINSIDRDSVNIFRSNLTYIMQIQAVKFRSPFPDYGIF